MATRQELQVLSSHGIMQNTSFHPGINPYIEETTTTDFAINFLNSFDDESPISPSSMDDGEFGNVGSPQIDVDSLLHSSDLSNEEENFIHAQDSLKETLLPLNSFNLGNPLITHNSDINLRILGVPNKSRVETRLKLCLQLVNSRGQNICTWKNLIMPHNLIAFTKRNPKVDENKIKPEESSFLKLESGVVCASNQQRQVTRCFGCIQRERKLNQKKKGEDSMESSLTGIFTFFYYFNNSVEEEQKRLLQFYCSPKVDFSHGEAIIPTRITCYCRHHEEKVGFQIWIQLKDSRDNVIASTISSPVMITDDHKTKSNQTGVKRPRVETIQPSLVEPPKIPLIEKIIPGEGPMTGGIEVTILGKDFTPSLSVMFGGNVTSKCDLWGQQTMVCLLPPSVIPGAVPVSFKGIQNKQQEVILFTYKDDAEKLLMELALQVVGMKLTGKIDDAKQIAMRIVSNNQQAVKNSIQGIGNQHKRCDLVLDILSKVLNMENTQSVDISLQNSRGLNMLMLAVMEGHHQLAQFLVAKGIDVNAQDKNGNTALHFAAMFEYQGMVSLLLSEAKDKIDIQILNNENMSARNVAEKNDNRSIPEMLEDFNKESNIEIIPESNENVALVSSAKPKFSERFKGFISRTKVGARKYKWLLSAAAAILVFGLLFAGPIPSLPKMFSKQPADNPNDHNSGHSQSPFGENHHQQQSSSSSPTMSQSYSYEIHTNWQLFFAYGLISTLIITALVYRNRREWKLKTVGTIFCSVFIVTGATHLVFLL